MTQTKKSLPSWAENKAQILPEIEKWVFSLIFKGIILGTKRTIENLIWLSESCLFSTKNGRRKITSKKVPKLFFNFLYLSGWISFILQSQRTTRGLSLVRFHLDCVCYFKFIFICMKIDWNRSKMDPNPENLIAGSLQCSVIR